MTTLTKETFQVWNRKIIAKLALHRLQSLIFGDSDMWDSLLTLGENPTAAEIELYFES